MSVSHLSLLEQPRGTGPPGDQTASECQPGVGHGALRTIQGYEAVHMIRKGQVRWLPKGDVVGLVSFIIETLGLRG